MWIVSERWRVCDCREAAKREREAAAQAAVDAKAAEEAAAAEAERQRLQHEEDMKAADEAEQARLMALEAQRLLDAEAERARLEASSAAAKAAEEASKAKGKLGVTVVECEGLKEMDAKSSKTEKLDGWGNKNDAYVICRVSETVFKQTATVDEGGKNPSWNGGKGEELLFEVSPLQKSHRGSRLPLSLSLSLSLCKATVCLC